MSRRQLILDAIKRGEQYKNIAFDLKCSREYISRVAVEEGIRKNKTRNEGGPTIQTTIALTREMMADLKSRGRMAIQIRQAVEEYLERLSKDGRRSNGEVQRTDTRAASRASPSTEGVMGSR